MNIIQFARRVGVSTATVSRAFHEPAKLQAKTLEFVLREAHRLHYYPSHIGRTLVRGRSDTIGLVWPIEVEGTYAIFAQRTLAAVAAALVRHNQDLFLCPVNRQSPAAIAHARRSIQRATCDAWLVLYPREDDPLISSLKESFRPVVLLMGKLNSMPAWKSVRVDQGHWIRDALERLKRGRARRVALLGCRPGEPDHQQRVARFRAMAPRYFSWSTIFAPGWPVKPAQVAEWFQRERPDAILGVDDLTALAALAALQDLGVAVPEKVQLIGFDDHPDGAAAKPRLASYRQPLEAMLDTAVRLAMRGRVMQELFHPLFMSGQTLRAAALA